MERMKLIDTPESEGLQQAPPCFQERAGGLQLGGLSWLRVFIACQALMMPSGAYRVAHKRCREVIKGELGFCPKGRPGTGEGGAKTFREGGKRAIFEWLGVEGVVHDRYDTNAVGGADYTVVFFSHDKAPFR